MPSQAIHGTDSLVKIAFRVAQPARPMSIVTFSPNRSSAKGIVAMQAISMNCDEVIISSGRAMPSLPQQSFAKTV